jgi:nucleotide-binding universal stress UspA family protein
MLKQILLGLDDTPSSIRAKDIALSLARMHKAGVTALTVVDAARIAPPEPVPMGGDSYKHHKDAVLVGRTRDELAELARRFTQECHAAQLSCNVAVREGDAIDALATASEVHDLVVIGRDAAFHAEPGGKVSDIVERLLKKTPRPLIVVPEGAGSADRVLVAYDGSAPAIRALQMFVLLGIAGKSEVTVATVHTERAAAETICARAVHHLGAHGNAARPRIVESGSDPASALVAIAAEIDARLIVMGTFGQRGWREFLLGSTTDNLLSVSKSPLFIHH